MGCDRLTFYRSGLVRKQWRWRYQAAGNGAKLANGGEGYNALVDAEETAFRVLGLNLAQRGDDLVERTNGTVVEVVYTRSIL